jgi:hypothetical protein
LPADNAILADKEEERGCSLNRSLVRPFIRPSNPVYFSVHSFVRSSVRSSVRPFILPSIRSIRFLALFPLVGELDDGPNGFFDTLDMSGHADEPVRECFCRDFYDCIVSAPSLLAIASGEEISFT